MTEITWVKNKPTEDEPCEGWYKCGNCGESGFDEPYCPKCGEGAAVLIEALRTRLTAVERFAEEAAYRAEGKGDSLDFDETYETYKKAMSEIKSRGFKEPGSMASFCEDKDG